MYIIDRRGTRGFKNRSQGRTQGQVRFRQYLDRAPRLETWALRPHDQLYPYGTYEIHVQNRGVGVQQSFSGKLPIVVVVAQYILFDGINMVSVLENLLLSPPSHGLKCYDYFVYLSRMRKIRRDSRDLKQLSHILLQGIKFKSFSLLNLFLILFKKNRILQFLHVCLNSASQKSYMGKVKCTYFQICNLTFLPVKTINTC